MAARGWDIEYEVPLSMDAALDRWRPEVTLLLGLASDAPSTDAEDVIRWALPPWPAEGGEAAGKLCDLLDEQITGLIR